MRTGTLAFLAGVVVLCYQTSLPSWYWLPGIVLPLLLYSWAPRLMWIPACAGAGFAWAWFVASASLGSGLSSDLEGVDVEVLGRVASIPERSSQGLRFEFDVEQLALGTQRRAAPQRVRLSWFRPTVADLPRAGERWRFTARLKRPRGFYNPGGFDYEAWLFQKGIQATGYVRHHQGQLLEPAGRHYLILQARQGLAERLAGMTAEHPMAGIVAALGLGERAGISASQWEVLRRTGTSHLVAISGLHVGLVAGLAFALTRRFACLNTRLLIWIPAPRAAALVALLSAVWYAALAGFALPTQRALIMVAVLMLAVWRQRQVVLLDTLLMALGVVLLIDPFAVLAAGFWLSFGAVAAIGYVISGRLGRQSRWRQGVSVQMGVSVGLLPVLGGLFGRASLVSPLVNLFAVPFIGLLVVPLTLLGVLLLPVWEDAAAWVIQATLWLLATGWPVLEWAANTRQSQLEFVEPGMGVLLLGIVAAGLLLAPRGIPGRWLGTVLLLPLLLAPASRPSAGGFRVALLDVGQGLASVIVTANHVLVYDTGPRYSSDFNAGSAVVLPYLRANGLKSVDRLIVSHLDNDHAGGALPVINGIPVTEVLSSDAAKKFDPGQQLCRQGQRWEWDGVQFEMLFPDNVARQRRGRNDRSCVLKVSNGKYGVLLTGDIEAASEHRLLAAFGDQLRADVLVAPHHGSNTSSTTKFIAAVQPSLVLFPVGYRNRYGFPASEVLARYRTQRTEIFDTATHGAIEIELPVRDTMTVRRYRDVKRRIWSSG